MSDALSKMLTMNQDTLNTLFDTGVQEKRFNTNPANSILNIINSCEEIIAKFDPKSNSAIIIKSASEIIKNECESSLDKKAARGGSNLIFLAKCAMNLLVISSELKAMLDDFDRELGREHMVERAFSYIQKMLLASESYRKDWLDTSGKKIRLEGECEQLGEAALLLVGIWAVKIQQTVGITDLVLSISEEDSNIETHATRTGTFVVLTEWKVAHTKSEFNSYVERAKKQSNLYLSDSLSTYKVNNLVYLVICTKNRMTDMAVNAEVDLNEKAGRRAFRVINLHVDTTSASIAAKQSTSI